MKKIILFFSLFTFSFSCSFLSDKVYYVDDIISKNILKSCPSLKNNKIYVSKYYINNKDSFGLDDIKIKEDKKTVMFGNIAISFKGRFVEKTNSKIKIKNEKNQLKIFHIK